MKKIIILTVLMTLLIVNSFSSIKVHEIEPWKNKNYQPLNSKDGIEFYYKFAECDIAETGSNLEEVILKVTNTTKNDLQISWDEERWYDETCYGCKENDKDNHFTVTLKAGESKEGSCETRDANTGLVIFSKYLNKPNTALFNKINIKNITSNILK